MLCWVMAVSDMGIQKGAVEGAQLIAAVVEFSDDAIIGSTLAGIVTSWNPAAQRLYGYSSQEIVGKSGRVLAPDDRAAQMSAVVDRVRDGETVEHFETTLVRKDAMVVPVQLTFAPIRDEGGVVVGVCTFHRDVTERGRAFDVAQRMEAIVESSDDAIIALTLEGVVTSWNPAAERLFGYTTEEIIGEPAERVTPKDRPQEMTDILAKVEAGEHIDHLETIRVRKDGSVFPVSLTVSASQWTRHDGVGRPSASQQASHIAWRACANGSQRSCKNAVLNRSAASMSAAVVTSYSPLVTASLASSVRTHVTETEAACGSRARITESSWSLVHGTLGRKDSGVITTSASSPRLAQAKG